ncbi:MAG TPA: zinc-binding dehydrogenase [Anaerolineaceae bacterium]|nr:zinc-binding dehydrogenase [Anaerolineaceae bacterium]
MATYKRTVFTGPGQIRFDDVEIPEPGPTQALVKVKSCAICTWEQRMYTGEEKFYPISGGHEVSGELVAVGKYVHTDAKIGDKVVAATLNRCGYCESCRKGLDSNCDNSFKPLRQVDVAGPSGLSEYCLIDDYMIYKGSNDVSYDELALTEPLACVIRSITKAKVRFAENVVVVGAGIMGLLHLTVAKKTGARVIVSEPNPERAKFALQLGADAVIDPTKESFVDQVKGLTNGRGADAIFCAVSIAGAVETAVDAAAKGGRVMVYASIHPRGTKISVDPNIFHGKEVTLTGTVSQSRQDLLESIRMISLGLVDLKPFISKVYPFLQLEDAIKAALRPDTYRVLVNM